MDDKISRELNRIPTDVVSAERLNVILKRGRRRKTVMIVSSAMSAVVLFLAVAWALSTVTVNPQDQVESAADAQQDSDTHRAATFAIRALGRSRLLDPSGKFFDYQSIELIGDGHWLTTFEGYDCSLNESAGRCGDLAGAQIEVMLQNGFFEVEQVVGPFESEEQQRLSQQRQRNEEEPPHYEFAQISAVRFGDRWTLQGTPIWSGPIPAPPDLGADCEARGETEGGASVALGALEIIPPADEDQRSGALYPVTLGSRPDGIRNPRFACRSLQVRGWQPLGEPQISVAEQESSVIVAGTLEWDGAPTRHLVTICAATVYGDSDRILGRAEQPFGSREDDSGDNLASDREYAIFVENVNTNEVRRAEVACSTTYTS